MLESFLSPNELLELPDSLRGQLAKPIGKLYVSKDSFSPEDQIKSFLQNCHNIIVSVGDVVTDSLFSINIYPDFAFIDNKTLRGEYKISIDSNMKRMKIFNPQATITYQSWKTIRDLYDTIKKQSRKDTSFKQTHSDKKQSVVINVDGEEDLLVIPCILEAPLDSLILYGQPNQGIVVVSVNQKIKLSTQELIRKFKKRTSVQS